MEANIQDKLIDKCIALLLIFFPSLQNYTHIVLIQQTAISLDKSVWLRVRHSGKLYFTPDYVFVLLVELNSPFANSQAELKVARFHLILWHNFGSLLLILE